MNRLKLKLLLILILLSFVSCSPNPSVIIPNTPPTTTQIGITMIVPSVTESSIYTSTESIINSSSAETPPSTSISSVSTLIVYYFDVGQGDAILIDQGATEILIDGGVASSGIANLIKPYVDGPIEEVIATHMDADHIGGLASVLNTYKVLNVWDNGATSTTVTYNTFKTAIQTNGAVEHIGRRGDTITTGSISFKVLNPVNTSGTSNNNSIVVRLDYGSVSFQFEGDAEQEAEASMLTAGLISHADILKVGHHGSRTASSPQFLNQLNPDIAIYSCGLGNSYGHPHQETLINLNNVGAEIFGTDVNGTVVVNTDGTTYNVTPSKATTPVKPLVASTTSTRITTTTTTTTTPTTTTTTSTLITTTTSVADLSLQVVSVTSPVAHGANATLTAKTTPGAQCTITVNYKSGPSTASGLGAKTADNLGNVSWTWKVGANTTPGSWQIVVTATSQGSTVTTTTNFTVN